MAHLSERYATLSKRHYIRKASAWNYWFDFASSKVEWYRRRYGDNWCLVINGSDTRDQAYVLPFKMLGAYFIEGNLESDGRRWVGTIIGGQLKLGPAAASVPVGQYYNRFDLLEPATPTGTLKPGYASVQEGCNLRP